MPVNPYPKVPFVIQPEPFTLLYAEDLLTAKPYTDPATGIAGAPRYACQCVIPATHSLLGTLQNTLLQIGNSAFPGREIKYPLRSGDNINAARVAAGKKPYDFLAGAFVLYGKSNEKTQAGRMLMPPRLVVLQGGRMVDYLDAQRSMAAQFFYSGVKACGSFTFQAYAGMGSGVTCYIDRVISFNEGERIVIGKSNEEMFDSDSMAHYTGHASVESVMPQPQPPQYAPPPGFTPPPVQPQYQPPPQPGYAPLPPPAYQPGPPVQPQYAAPQPRTPW